MAKGEVKSPGRPLSESELKLHLNSKVNYGKNGPVGPRSRNRGIVDVRSDDADDSSAPDLEQQQREQQFFLRRLNNRPTLVLNANYLVSFAAGTREKQPSNR